MPNNLTKEEAIEAMKQGKKVTHSYMSFDGWVKSNPEGTSYEFEDGYTAGFTLFWVDRQSEGWVKNWSIVND